MVSSAYAVPTIECELRVFQCRLDVMAALGSAYHDASESANQDSHVVRGHLRGLVNLFGK